MEKAWKNYCLYCGNVELFFFCHSSVKAACYKKRLNSGLYDGNSPSPRLLRNYSNMMTGGIVAAALVSYYSKGPRFGQNRYR
jgi:hypothetical protein